MTETRLVAIEELPEHAMVRVSLVRARIGELAKELAEALEREHHCGLERDENIERAEAAEKERGAYRDNAAMLRNRVRALEYDREKAERERDEYRRAEKDTSDAYLRLRRILGALITHEDHFEHTEKKARALVKERDEARALLERIRERIIEGDGPAHLVAAIDAWTGRR